MTAPQRTWPRLLAALLAREDLTADDTRWAMTEVMDDAHEPAQLAFLTALRANGETAAELGRAVPADPGADRIIGSGAWEIPLTESASSARPASGRPD